MPVQTFEALPFSLSKTVSWIHIGDTHLTRSGEQNEIDLGRIVDEINAVYAKGGIDFVFVPGDIAEDGSVGAYGEFRKHLDQLKLPWCAIVGDHDVHEKSFSNFQEHVATDLYGAFTIGPYRFLRLNAFSEPRPDSFIVDQRQLDWLEGELAQCERSNLKAVVFLHCYPSDLKQGGAELTSLFHRYPVLLVDMGHTHYNEISNDGKVLYSATRSTGQIEEGAVGYSITTLDENCVSWHFVALGTPSLVAITQPTDQRLRTERTEGTFDSAPIPVHAKTWSAAPVAQAHIQIGDKLVPLASSDGISWSGEIDAATLRSELSELRVVALTQVGEELTDAVRVPLGEAPQHSFRTRDQDNKISSWEERGLLGTQLGPNKNGKKW